MATDPNQSNIQYEAMRAWALARPRPQIGPAGVTSLLTSGVVAWLLGSAGEPRQPQPQAEIPLPQTLPTPGPAVTKREQALANVLATMVAYCQTEALR